MVKPQLSPLSRFSGSLLVAGSVLFFGGCATQTATSPSPSIATSSATNPTTATAPSIAPSTNTTGQKNVRVSLAFLFQSLDAPLLVAMKKGYFTQEGLNVTYERGTGNVAAISNLGTGKFDVAFSDIYNTLEFNDKNPSEKIIAVAIPFNKAPFSILTLKKNGINEPKQLAGKKMGAPAGDGPRKLWPLFAKEIGVDPNSIEWVTMEPKLRETFLVQGQVEAISGFSTSAMPSILKAGIKAEEVNIFYYNDFGLDFYGNGILTKASFAKENPDTVKAFVRAYLKGLQDTIKDPEAALDMVMAADESKLMDRNAEKVRLQIALEKLMITPEAESLGLGGANPERLSKSIQQTVDGFQLKTKFKVEDIFDASFLPAKEQRMMPTAAERKTLK